jgi:hypothetical protein
MLERLGQQQLQGDQFKQWQNKKQRHYIHRFHSATLCILHFEDTRRTVRVTIFFIYSDNEHFLYSLPEHSRYATKINHPSFDSVQSSGQIT